MKDAEAKKTTLGMISYKLHVGREKGKGTVGAATEFCDNVFYGG